MMEGRPKHFICEVGPLQIPQYPELGSGAKLKMYPYENTYCYCMECTPDMLYAK